MKNEKFTYLNNANTAFIEDLYNRFLESPDEVEPSWRKFFEGFEFAQTVGQSLNGQAPVSSKEVAVIKLINAYRSRGHLIAHTNPIRERRKHKADLELSYFGLSEEDLDSEFDAGDELGIGRQPLRTILAHLDKTYCGSIGVEFMYCRNEKLRHWFYDEMELSANQPDFTNEKKKGILEKLREAVVFESFLQKKYVGKKRFSLEGLEALIPSLDSAINQGAKMGVKEFVFGMAHRGRLNVLVNIFNKTYEQVFTEFEETLPEKTESWSGDVKYHLGRSADITTEGGQQVHLSLVPNPSHLEAVNPVVQGLVYRKAQSFYENDPTQIMPILIHGDAAVAGQGVNYELANMAELEGYSTKGTVHIVLNNQIGFTANYKEARSSMYCTDLAKVTESPVFHVNADDSQAVVHAVEMAVKIRQTFGIDVYVDILGYRRYGHNEGDEPRFTQPLLYETISKHPDVYVAYLEKLVQGGDITKEEAKKAEAELQEILQSKLDYSRKKKPAPKFERFGRYWSGYRASTKKDFNQSIETGVKKSLLDKIAKSISTEPKSFNLFTKMKKLLSTRKALYFDKKQVDWAVAELLAYGSLLTEGSRVRVSGQDSQRGTFSHRHAVIKDVKTEDHYIPINNIQSKQEQLEILNSHLSEYCVMGFEYGVSLAAPHDLTIWEAQFGDFSNGAQIVIDQFLSCSATKWQRFSGLTLFLPHGYEGQGPEHSSARLERYLQLCAGNNMYIVNCTTPANFFHLLRRQVKNEFRMPLIVFTPKSLLRHPKVVSDVKDLEKGYFKEILDDERVSASKVRKVLLCSGKIYYDLLDKAEADSIQDIAIVRLEQLYPLPDPQITALIKKYAKASEWVWVQEEPENMGAWTHLLRRFPKALTVVAREENSSPAVGNSKVHAIEQENIINTALK